jgi:hypothetical protein
MEDELFRKNYLLKPVRCDSIAPDQMRELNHRASRDRYQLPFVSSNCAAVSLEATMPRARSGSAVAAGRTFGVTNLEPG